MAADTFREHQAALVENLTAVSEARAVVDPAQHPELNHVLNSGQFSALFGLDLSVTLEYLGNSRSEWKRRYFARILALLASEAFDDFGKLLGQPMREFAHSLPDPALLSEVSTVHGKLSQIGRDYGPLVRDIRNAVAAHRDHDAERQIAALDSLDLDLLSNLGIELVEWTTDLFNLFTHAAASYRASQEPT